MSNLPAAWTWNQRMQTGDLATDQQLIEAFLRHRSHEAFAALVERHGRWLFAAALRQLGDHQLAEDATQTVFVLLFQKAPAMHSHEKLSGWLFKTLGYTIKNIRKARQRRRKREQQATGRCIVKQAACSRHSDDLLDHLDAAVAELGETDRGAILMRFHQALSFQQISWSLGISEDAARKRVARAVAGLRRRLGADLTEASVAAVTAFGTDRFPATLTESITRAAPNAKPAALSVKLLMAGNLKIAIAIILLAAVATGWLIIRPFAAGWTAGPTTIAISPAANAAPATEPSASYFPLYFANSDFSDRFGARQYSGGVDASAKRLADSQSPSHLKSLVPSTASAARSLKIPADALRGRHVRLSAWIKTADVQNWVGMQFVVLGPGGRIFARDDMGDRPISGSTDWTQYQSVEDVPQDANGIVIAVILYGAGEVWADDFQIDIAGPDAPTNDDSAWKMYSPVSPFYSCNPDSSMPHEGRPAICLSSLNPPPQSYAVYNRNDRFPEKYRGHHIRVSVWLKSDSLDGSAGPWVLVRGPGDRDLRHDDQFPVKGTTDWKEYSTTAYIPSTADDIIYGVAMNGTGKLWIDDVRLKLADQVAP
jgi:RNA polymerase sigma factor (sigma-70 family)